MILGKKIESRFGRKLFWGLCERTERRGGVVVRSNRAEGAKVQKWMFAKGLADWRLHGRTFFVRAKTESGLAPGGYQLAPAGPAQYARSMSFLYTSTHDTSSSFYINDIYILKVDVILDCKWYCARIRMPAI